MIISHRHKFIFIKTKKTAGTSVEIALSKFCGPHDIITPISPADEALRFELGYRSAQNYEKPFSQYTGRDWLKLLLTFKKKKKFFNHIPAAQIIKQVDPQIWGTYFKFCYERNPWDKTVSLYYWETRDLAERPTFSEYLHSGRVEKLRDSGGRSLYTVNGQVVMDRVFKYEEMEASLREIQKKLGLPEPLELPHTKAGFRKKDHTVGKVMTSQESDYIRHLYEQEIRDLNYGSPVHSETS